MTQIVPNNMEDKREWPLSIPHQLSSEEQSRIDNLVRELESGELQFRPLTAKERLRMERLQADPVTISTSRCSADTFEVRMFCHGCGAEEIFDHLAPRPWIIRRKQFEHTHKTHLKKETNKENTCE